MFILTKDNLFQRLFFATFAISTNVEKQNRTKQKITKHRTKNKIKPLEKTKKNRKR